MNQIKMNQINIGLDCEEIINNYKSQMDYTEKFDKVMKQLKETIEYSIVDNTTIIRKEDDIYIQYDLCSSNNLSFNKTKLIYEDTDEEFISKLIDYNVIDCYIHDDWLITEEYEDGFNLIDYIRPKYQIQIDTDQNEISAAIFDRLMKLI